FLTILVPLPFAAVDRHLSPFRFARRRLLTQRDHWPFTLTRCRLDRFLQSPRRFGPRGCPVDDYQDPPHPRELIGGRLLYSNHPLARHDAYKTELHEVFAPARKFFGGGNRFLKSNQDPRPRFDRSEFGRRRFPGVANELSIAVDAVDVPHA